MAIFVNEKTKVIVQGLTGGQGKFHGLRNRDYGTNVVGGVTPGKGGQDVEGIPVFNSVAEAVAATGADADPHPADVPRRHVLLDRHAGRAMAHGRAGEGWPNLICQQCPHGKGKGDRKPDITEI